MNRITPHTFVQKWRGSTLTERAASQSHFIDLCALVNLPTPTDEDQTGAFYTFEKGVPKTGGGQGFADVWRRGAFAWEYKKKKRNLTEAYNQRPEWLLNAHKALDDAVLAAYGWDKDIGEESLLEKLLELNQRRSKEVSK